MSGVFALVREIGVEGFARAVDEGINLVVLRASLAFPSRSRYRATVAE
jgi:hypothetical protein